MSKINFKALLLAFFVILMFSCVGIAIAYKSILFSILFLILGFASMGLGIRLKSKSFF